jgi:hypothetical protein
MPSRIARIMGDGRTLIGGLSQGDRLHNQQRTGTPATATRLQDKQSGDGPHTIVHETRVTIYPKGSINSDAPRASSLPGKSQI